MTTPILHIDFETRSACDLQVAGLDNYAKHPTTDAWCMAYAFDSWGSTPPELWAPGYGRACSVVQGYVEAGGLVVAHNAAFELAIWNNVMVPRYGWPPLKPEQVICTMALAYAMSLPGSLERAAAAVGLDMQKDAAGQRLMLQMCRPRSENPMTWWDDKDRLERLYAYCKNDVEVERALHKRLLSLPAAEQALWQLDYEINSRGVYVDRPTVEAAIAIVESEQARLNNEMRVVTNNAVATCTAVGQLGDWIKFRGVKMEGVAKADVIDALASPDLPKDVAHALRLRQEAAKTSTAKLAKMVETASSDGRLRNMFAYHGAGTGRWAARKVQLHNLPRPKIEQHEIEGVIDILNKSLTPGHKARLIEMLYGPPLDTISSCLRGMLTAAPQHHLIAGDFANIEGRVIAWLAGEEWKLEAFKAADEKRGPGIYELTYARSFNVDVATITKSDPRRQVGKVMELLLGFQGGIGALRRGGCTQPDDELQSWVDRWRGAHPHVVEYWYALDRAAKDAVEHPGVRTWAGELPGMTQFLVKGSFLWAKLPSGRNLCYPYPRIDESRTYRRPDGTIKVISARKANKEGVPDDWKLEREDFGVLWYMNVDGVTGKWDETHTYGGKLSENITQAVARDILAHAMTELDKRHYPIVLHVHDEAVVEVPREAKDPATQDNVKRIMKSGPAWSAGLPIAVDVWRGRRYRK